MSEKLKPVRCGCGGEAYTVRQMYGTGRYLWTARCEECQTTTTVYRTEAEAITAWNRAMGERTAKVMKIEVSRNPRNLVYKCKNCGQYTHRTAWSRPVMYCPSCGSRLEWSE